MTILKERKVKKSLIDQFIEKVEQRKFFPMKIKCRNNFYKHYPGICKTDFALKKPCKSVLEINEHDVKAHSFKLITLPPYEMKEYSIIAYGVICPVCGEFIVLNENKIPNAIKEKAQFVEC